MLCFFVTVISLRETIFFTQRRKDYNATTIEMGIAERLCFFVIVVSLREKKNAGLSIFTFEF